MDLQKISKLLENKDFYEKICKLNVAEDIQKLFKEYGLELSIEDIKELERMTKEAQRKAIEMEETELENVSGGGAKIYQFGHGMFDTMLPQTASYNDIEPKTIGEKAAYYAGKATAWTVGLPITLMSQAVDSAMSYKEEELKKRKETH